ncbi:MAG TPA: DUF3305 domain-containing protein [Usitatibacter sp.]|nr:DUF3305 domain-containing protein [Usitatibacter sp.]
MPDHPCRKLSVVLQRQAVSSRWESHRWSVHGVLPDVGGERRPIVQSDSLLQMLYPGFDVFLYPDEAEGYFLNVSTEEPSVFVGLRTDEATGDPYPYQTTLSYNEAARWMDGGERVERVPAWLELAAWMGQFVELNYRPEPRKRRKPRSFAGKEGVLRPEGDQ